MSQIKKNILPLNKIYSNLCCVREWNTDDTDTSSTDKHGFLINIHLVNEYPQIFQYFSQRR
jgi:hypothetical protein